MRYCALLIVLLAARSADASDLPRDEVVRIVEADSVVPIADLVRDAGEKLNCIVTIDDSILDARIKFVSPASLDLDILEAVLWTYGVISEEELGDRDVLRFLHSRNISAPPLVLSLPFYEEPGLEGTRIVTALYSLHATTRSADVAGPLERIAHYTHRAMHVRGNVGSRPLIVITGERASIDDYIALAVALDRSEGACDVTIVRIVAGRSTSVVDRVNRQFARPEFPIHATLGLREGDIVIWGTPDVIAGIRRFIRTTLNSER